MYEGKLQEIFEQNDSKYYSASNYLDNLNQVQSYLSVKIENSRRVAESGPVCLHLKGPHRLNAIWQREANFGFLLSFNFRLFLKFLQTFQQFKLVRPHILQNFFSCSVFTFEN